MRNWIIFLLLGVLMLAFLRQIIAWLKGLMSRDADVPRTRGAPASSRGGRPAPNVEIELVETKLRMAAAAFDKKALGYCLYEMAGRQGLSDEQRDRLFREHERCLALPTLVLGDLSSGEEVVLEECIRQFARREALGLPQESDPVVALEGRLYERQRERAQRILDELTSGNHGEAG